MSGAGRLAGRRVPFGNGKGAGNGLCVFLENGMLLAQPLIIFIGQIHGTYFGAVPAGGTLGWIDKARRFLHRDVKVSRGSFYFCNLRRGDKINVEMPADLDQFGRNNSHGTVIGGKRLVQFGHDSANG